MYVFIYLCIYTIRVNPAEATAPEEPSGKKNGVYICTYSLVLYIYVFIYLSMHLYHYAFIYMYTNSGLNRSRGTFR